ncbi:MAG: tetratricopeptide repeat protein, partial [Bacteroidota bacterium]
MKIICTCILCIGFSYSCFSQETDTLIYQEENWKNEYDSLSALMEKGQFKEALPIADKVIRLANIEYGSNDTTYALSLNKKGEIFSYLGQYEQALSLFFEAKTILIDKSISIDYNYANLLNNIGGVYLATGDYLQAQKYFLQTINIYDKEDEEYNPNYVRALNNLAGTYNEMGYLHKAEPLFKRVVEIRKIIFTENHPRYAFSLDNLGLLYRKIGRYSEAEKLFLEAAEILASELGNKHPWYAISLKERAALYQTMGRFYEAQELYDQVITIFKEKLGNEHPLLARSLNDYGVLCTTIGDTPKAHESLVEASKIFRLKFGKNSEYSTTTFNLANLCVIMGRFKEAETLYLEALKIDNEQLGADHPSYATSLNKLADLYRFQENYDEAEKMYLQAKEIRKEQLGEEHPDYATSLHNLALLYQAMGRYGETEPHMRQASDILVANLELNFGGLSEKEKEQYLQTVKRSFEVYYSFALQRKATNPAVTTMSYDNVLVNKGLLLASSQQIRRAILNSQDTSLLATYNEFVDLKQQLATLYSRPIDQRYTSTDSLEQLANRLERALSAGSAEFQVQQQAFQVRWQDVQSSLQEGEAAVEFINFSYRNEKAWTDTTYYAALVLRPDDEHPQLVQLCTQAHLDSLLSGKNNETLADVLYIDYANDSSQMLRDLSGEAHQLYRLIWQPLDSLLS